MMITTQRNTAVLGTATVVLALSAAVQAGPVPGLAELQAANPAINGSGVTVAQAEATNATFDAQGQVINDPNDFEVDPNHVGTTRPITYINNVGATATVYPNAVGVNSNHADLVATNFYGAGSPAPQVAGVLNYNANYFIDQVIVGNASTAAKVINQSFSAESTPANDAQLNQFYDNYVVNHNVIILTGTGTSNSPGQVGAPTSPSTAYNSIAVAAFGAGASTGVGPLADGRSKPDITSESFATSFSTPTVSAFATLLVQSGQMELGGSGTAGAATDAKTVKALLLNGATKPADWTHNAAHPLDARYGAGVANIYNSYLNLTAGKKGPGNVGQAGWNMKTITSGAADATDHYLLDLTGGIYTLQSTLVWLRHGGAVTPGSGDNPPTVVEQGINNLDLFLVNTDTNTPVDLSVSPVDNVEHLYSVNLAPGHYDLQVLKHGGAGVVSDSEEYSVAFSAALVQAVPEPGTLVVMGMGVVGMLVRRRKN
jgi:hypothetical protein